MVQLAGWKFLAGGLNGGYLLFSPPKTSDIFLNAQDVSRTGKGKRATGQSVAMCFLGPYLNGTGKFPERPEARGRAPRILRGMPP